MFSVYIDVPKRIFMLPQNVMLQFCICCYKNCYATWMLLEKLCYIKTNINFRDLRTDSPQSVGSRSLFYLMSIMPKMFIEDSSNLKRPKNLKSINNTTISYLVSCRVKLKILVEFLKKYLKCNCIKSEPVQKDFSSILLKLQVTSLDSPQIVRTTFLQNASVSATSTLYIFQWFSSTNTINILIYLKNPFWVNALLKFHAFCILTAHLETS